MKKYNVELDLERIYELVGGERRTKIVFCGALTVITTLISIVGPAWFYFLANQEQPYPNQTIYISCYFMLFYGLSYFVYHSAFKENKGYILPLISEPLIMVHFFIAATLYAFAAGLPYSYIALVCALFFISNFCVLHSALTAFGPLIDLRLRPTFERKDENTFICHRDLENDDFSAKTTLDEIISTTKFGWVVTLVSWSIWLVFPLSFYLFSDTYIQDNEATSGTVSMLSVLCLTIYIGTRKAVLYQLIVCRAILRKQAGY